jgi:rhodanese-related sulfurtransferase
MTMDHTGNTKRGGTGRPIFEDLSEEQLLEIASVVEEQVVPEGTMICRQGDPGDSFYLIRSGKVRVFRKDDEGVVTELSRLGPGAGFGEIALLTGKPRSANVETVEETRLDVLTKKHFDRVLKDHPHVSLTFIKQMSTLLSRDETRLEMEAQRKVQARKLSLIDLVVICGLSVLCGLLFNFSNPSGLTLAPESWFGEPLSVIRLEEARALLGKGEAIFVDARPESFFEEGHIETALNLPMAVFDIAYVMGLGEVDLEKPIVVYGRTISRLYDDSVARQLLLRGHSNVKLLKGDLSAWKKKGYAVTS